MQLKTSKILGYLRRASRNLEIWQAFVVFLCFSIVVGLVIGPPIYNRAKIGIEGITEKKNSREFIDIDAEVWVYTWIRTSALNMSNATVPAQWRAARWADGCFARRETKWNTLFQEAIKDACSELSIVQQKYNGQCLNAKECKIPDEAKVEIEGILDKIQQTFITADFVLPYRQEEENSIE